MRAFQIVVGSLLTWGSFHTLSAQELDFPSTVFDTSAHQGHCIDVTQPPYSCDKTGVNDCAPAIERAISDIFGEDTGTEPRDRILYFPNGTYLISNTLNANWSETATGNTTSGSLVVTNLTTTADLYPGYVFICADFPSGTSVAKIDSSSQIEVALPEGSTLTGSTGTHTGIAVEYTANNYRLHFVGQSESGVVIKLGNAVSGFTNAAASQAMIRTASDGGTNNGFDNSVWNMTLDTGTNNPGAVGIQYLANNIGSIRNVTIKATGTGSGLIGLQMTNAYPGPCMIEDVEVDGFATGVSVSQSEYGVTLENLVLNNQSSVGLANAGNGVFVRKMTSTNSNPVHAVINGGNGLLVLIDSTATYTGGTTTANAVDNTAQTSGIGGAFVRNFTSSGYALAVSNPAVAGGTNTGVSAPNGYVTEYSTHTVLTPGLSNSQTSSLNLPIQETPVFTDNNQADWYQVPVAPDQTYRDESAQIQTAIDNAAAAGATTLYFVPGRYYLANPITIHGSIQRILGFGAYLMPGAPSGGGGTYGTNNASNLQPVIVVGAITGSLEIDYLSIYPTSLGGGSVDFIGIQHNSSQTLTLRDFAAAGGSSTAVSYNGSAGVGNLFLDDVDGANWIFNNPGQQIWARQMDPEGDTLGTSSAYEAKITNTGSIFWVLGLKTEGFGTLVESTNQASTEILGAFCYAVHSFTDGHLQSTLDDNLFDVQNSNFSACYLTNYDPDYPNQVGETEGTQTGTLLDYSSAATGPKAYIRIQGSVDTSMVPLVVAAPTLDLSIPGMDIGSVGVAGTASVSNGIYSVTGSGTDIYGDDDSFHFCPESVPGDCTIIAEVTAVQDTNGNAKAAIMMRSTTTAGSIFAMCDITPGGANFITRSTTGVSAVDVAYKTSISFPYWEKLVRSGNNFSAYLSPNGTTWTQMGTTQTVSVASPALVGLAVTSHANTTLCTGTFANVTITSP